MVLRKALTATSSAVVPGASPSTSTLVPEFKEAPLIDKPAPSELPRLGSDVPRTPASALFTSLEAEASPPLPVPLAICRPTPPLSRAPSSPPSILL